MMQIPVPHPDICPDRTRPISDGEIMLYNGKPVVHIMNDMREFAMHSPREDGGWDLYQYNAHPTHVDVPDAFLYTGWRVAIPYLFMSHIEAPEDTKFTFRGVRIRAFKDGTHTVYVDYMGNEKPPLIPGVRRATHNNAWYRVVTADHLVYPFTEHNAWAVALHLAAEEAARREDRIATDIDCHGLPPIHYYPDVAPIERIA